MNLTLEIKAKYPKGKTNKETLEDIKGKLNMLEFTAVTVKNVPQTRSKLLNDSLHLFLQWIETHANRLGLTMDVLIFKPEEKEYWMKKFKEDFEMTAENEKMFEWFFFKAFPEMTKTALPITTVSLKNYFREIGRFAYDKLSTTQLTNFEFCEVLKKFQEIVADRLDFHEEFPNRKALELGNLKKDEKQN